ncbi:endonuclease domain-containing protein [Vibrio alginolyticus]
MKVFPRSLYEPSDTCGLCGRKLSGRTHTDHDHATGLIRGGVTCTNQRGQ